MTTTTMMTTTIKRCLCCLKPSSSTVKEAIFIFQLCLTSFQILKRECHVVPFFCSMKRKEDDIDHCFCHFVSFYSQSMVDFKVTLHNAVARKSYLSIQSATLTVVIDGFQTDWQLICTSYALILLKALTMSLSTFQLCFNEQRYHQQLY